MEYALRKTTGSLLLSLVVGIAIFGVISLAALLLIGQHYSVRRAFDARSAERQVVAKLQGFLLDSARGRNFMIGDSSVSVSNRFNARDFSGVRQSRYLPDLRRSTILRYRSLDTSYILTRAFPLASGYPSFCLDSFDSAEATPSRLSAQHFWAAMTLGGELCIRAGIKAIHDPRCESSGRVLTAALPCSDSEAFSRIELTNITDFLNLTLLAAPLRDRVALYLDRRGCLRRYSMQTLTHQPIFCGDRRTKLTAFSYRYNGSRWLKLEFRRPRMRPAFSYFLPLGHRPTTTQLRGAYLNAIL